MPAPDYRDALLPHPSDLVASAEAEMGRPCTFVNGWTHHRQTEWAVVAIYQARSYPDPSLGEMHQIRYIIQTSDGARVGGVVSSWFQDQEEA